MIAARFDAAQGSSRFALSTYYTTLGASNEVSHVVRRTTARHNLSPVPWYVDG